MTKDEILQAFHLIAMGRARHPLQDQLAEELARVFAMREPVPMAELIAATPVRLPPVDAVATRALLAGTPDPVQGRKAKGK